LDEFIRGVPELWGSTLGCIFPQIFSSSSGKTMRQIPKRFRDAHVAQTPC